MSRIGSQSPASSTSDELVLFMGMVRRGEFESLQERGLPLGILIDTNSKTRLGDISKFALVEHFDFSRPLPELIEAVRQIQARFRIACLYNVIEFYVEKTAEVALALGLAGIAPNSARLCLDKISMRQRFQERIGQKATARFQCISHEEELLQYAAQMGYPCFLQPGNVSASMWSTRNPDEETLASNYRAMVAELPHYYRRLGRGGIR